MSPVIPVPLHIVLKSLTAEIGIIYYSVDLARIPLPMDLVSENIWTFPSH